MESLNGKLSDELFNREVFETLMGKWRRGYCQVNRFEDLLSVLDTP